jgi:hypothetical protein
MFGFIVGTVCLIALMKVLRRTHGYGWGPRWGGCGGYGSYDGGYESYGTEYGGSHRFGFGRGFGRRWLLRRLFERLQTTPGQERVIVQAIERLAENRTLLREEFTQTRADVARAVDMGLVDDATLEETFARHDRVQAQLRVVAVDALKTVTEALDERQRKILAGLLSSRGGFFHRGPDWGGPGVWA